MRDRRVFLFSPKPAAFRTFFLLLSFSFRFGFLANQLGMMTIISYHRFSHNLLEGLCYILCGFCKLSRIKTFGRFYWRRMVFFRFTFERKGSGCFVFYFILLIRFIWPPVSRKTTLGGIEQASQNRKEIRQSLVQTVIQSWLKRVRKERNGAKKKTCCLWRLSTSLFFTDF